LFQREKQVNVEQLRHTTLAIARLRFLSLPAKIWRRAGRVGVSYRAQYAARGIFQRLMNRLRKIGWTKAHLATVENKFEREMPNYESK